MKKRLAVLAIVLMLVLSLVFACGCVDKGDKVTKRVTVYLVDADGGSVECTINTTGETLEALLIEKQEELGIEYEDSTYGMYITSIRGWEMPSNGFVSILVSFDSVEGSSVKYTDAESVYNYHYVCQNGVECDSSLFGAAGLPIVNGATYVLIILTY